MSLTEKAHYWVKSSVLLILKTSNPVFTDTKSASSSQICVYSVPSQIWLNLISFNLKSFNL